MVWMRAAAPSGPKIDLKIKDAIGRQWQCSRCSAISICRIGLI